MELHALGQSVLGGLFDREVAAAERIAESDCGNLTADNGYTANLLRNIFVIFGFGHGVNSGLEVIHLNHAAICGFNGLVDAVALDAEGNAVHFSVLADLDDFGTACRRAHLEIGRNGVVVGRNAGHHVLIYAFFSRHRPDEKARTHIGGIHAAVELDGDRVIDGLGRGEGQCVAADGCADPAADRHIVITEHIVAVSEGDGVFAVFVFHLIGLCGTRRIGGEARTGIVPCHIR